MAKENLKSLLAALGRRGPHTVRRGDLSLAGLPGIVMTPESGRGLPALAFGHGWLQPAARYTETLRHFASWGIVVAAPATHRGPVPSHIGLATDLRTALDICVGVRLGAGGISVNPERLAVGGHSMGAGAAVLAAAHDARIKALVAFAVAETSPSAAAAATTATAPALFLNAEQDSVTPADTNAEPVARAWGGRSTVRTVDGSSDLGLVEGRSVADLFLKGGSERRTQKMCRALITGFLLAHLTGEDRFAALADVDVDVAGTTPVELDATGANA